MPLAITTNTRFAPGTVQEIFDDRVVVDVAGAPQLLQNAGLISITGTMGIAVNDRGGDLFYTAPVFWNEAGGIVQVYMVEPVDFRITYGVSMARFTFVNEGVIDVWSSSNDGKALAIDFRGTFGSYFNNAGVISATGTVAYGVEYFSTGRFTNTGRIEAVGREVAEGVRFNAVGFRDSFSNAGTIVAEVSKDSP